MAVGEEAEVADAVEAVWPRVQQEAADELGGMKRHHARRVAMAIIAPAEGDDVIVQADEAAVGDSDAVGIAAKIGEHVLRRAEGRLGIDDPVDPALLGHHAGEGLGPVQRGESPEEGEFACVMRLGQGLGEPAAEQAREDMNGQEEVRAAGDLAAVLRQGASGNEAMDMGMVRERLPPAVQDGAPTDLAAQMLPIGGDGLQGPDRGFEQDGIDDGLVLEGDRPDRGRHGEHDVDVGRGQEVPPPLVEPGLAGRPLALRAMPVAAGNGRLCP